MAVQSAFRAPDVFLRRGFKTNPFCQLSPSELAEVMGVPAWLEEVVRGDWEVLVLVGPSGLGKTSAAHMVMRALAPSGEGVCYLRLPEHRPRLPRRPPAMHLVVLDSVQRLPPRQRRKVPRWLRHPARHLLVGQEDVVDGVRLERSVLRMTPPPTGVAELRRWYRHRVERVLLAGGEVPELGEAEALKLLEDSGGNRMLIQEALYARFEALVSEPL